MTGLAEHLDSIDEIEEQDVVLADGRTLMSRKMGNTSFRARNGTGGTIEVLLKNVIVVDGLAVNLISVQAITEEGYNVTFDGRSCSISKGGLPFVTGVKEGRYYRLDC